VTTALTRNDRYRGWQNSGWTGPGKTAFDVGRRASGSKREHSSFDRYNLLLYFFILGYSSLFVSLQNWSGSLSKKIEAFCLDLYYLYPTPSCVFFQLPINYGYIIEC
jgi:hypothetical protein